MSNTGSNPKADLPHTERLVRSAGVVSIAVFMSRITGLLRESVMARLFGAGLVYDAFMLGFRIPNLARDLFAEGALSSAFVPTFTEYLTTRSKEEAAKLANLVASALIVIVGLVCAVGIVLAPLLVRLLAPGYAEVPGKFALAVHMTRIMFPFLLLVALAAQAMGVLNASNRFGVPAISSMFFNLGSIGFGILLGITFGPLLHLSRIEGMAIGVVLGGAMQLCWQFPTLHGLGYRFRPSFNWSDPGLTKIRRLMGPAVLGSAAVQVNVMVNTNFASTIFDPVSGYNGPVSWLSYAFRFMQLPLGLFGVAMASATLPSISRSAAVGDIAEFRQTLSHSLGMVFLLTLPSSVGLAVLGKSIIGAIYQSGHFNLYDTQRTALALSCYAIGLTGYASLKVLVPAFYALGDARTPMYVSLISILINYAAADSMIRLTGLGHAGLALSTSLVALFGFTVLFLILRGRIGGIHGRALAAQLGKISMASLAMAGAVALSSGFISAHMGVSQLARLADLGVSVPLGFAVYYVCCRMLGLSGIDLAIRAFFAPIQRRFFPRQVETDQL
ncbi:MAG TPA: murein biosynthesis integral membrane protein MurJ [Bryobacteraceae bacterium]|nr:murein biosynthesis integral membrane protein MurJ [Bryobacteraceae bacterium]